MKAKIKKTGEIVDVYYESQVYKESVLVNGRQFIEDELDFDVQKNEVHNVDWQTLRCQYAGMAMLGVMNFFGSIGYNEDAIAKIAVEQADTLIEELKKK